MNAITDKLHAVEGEIKSWFTAEKAQVIKLVSTAIDSLEDAIKNEQPSIQAGIVDFLKTESLAAVTTYETATGTGFQKLELAVAMLIAAAATKGVKLLVNDAIVLIQDAYARFQNKQDAHV